MFQVRQIGASVGPLGVLLLYKTNGLQCMIMCISKECTEVGDKKLDTETQAVEKRKRGRTQKFGRQAKIQGDKTG